MIKLPSESDIQIACPRVVALITAAIRPLMSATFWVQAGEPIFPIDSRSVSSCRLFAQVRVACLSAPPLVKNVDKVTNERPNPGLYFQAYNSPAA